MPSKQMIKASAAMTFVVIAVGLGSAPGCGGGDDSSFPTGNGSDASAASDGTSTGFGDGQGFNSGDSGGPTCVSGLCTQAVDCTGKGTGDTTISGVVTDPAGKNPLYNVLVYIPNFPDKVPGYTDGPSCDVCGSGIPGGLASSAVTDIHGAFTLTKVPVGANIPVIVQVGKWRRSYTFSNVNACVENPAPSNDVYRLPKNQSEGHIPHIAITTGGADTMECFFPRLGLDMAEFNAGGRVGLYAGKDDNSFLATKQYDAALGGASFPDARAFWNDINQMNAYDIIVYSCEGTAYDSDKTAKGIPNTEDFVNRGGKMFASHWHRGFFSLDTALSSIGTWKDLSDPKPNPSDGTVDQGFPKGSALALWLQAVGASTTVGTLSIGDPRENVYSIVSPGTEWVYLNKGSTPQEHVPEFTTVDTPVGASDDKLCGKAAFSDLHVSAGAGGDKAGSGNAWPDECATGDLSAQEKALEFLFFDLSACVQNDSQPVQPPPR